MALSHLMTLCTAQDLGQFCGFTASVSLVAKCSYCLLRDSCRISKECVKPCCSSRVQNAHTPIVAAGVYPARQETQETSDPPVLKAEQLACVSISSQLCTCPLPLGSSLMSLPTSSQRKEGVPGKCHPSSGPPFCSLNYLG